MSQPIQPLNEAGAMGTRKTEPGRPDPADDRSQFTPRHWPRQT
jgi:hypothetical protein